MQKPTGVTMPSRVVSKAGRGAPRSTAAGFGLHGSRSSILASRPVKPADRGGACPAPVREKPSIGQPRSSCGVNQIAVSDLIWGSGRLCLGAARRVDLPGAPNPENNAAERQDDSRSPCALDNSTSMSGHRIQRRSDQHGREASSLWPTVATFFGAAAGQQGDAANRSTTLKVR